MKHWRGKASSKEIGNGFEATFKQMAQMRGWAVVRIPDGCKHVGGGALIPVKSPFDYVLARDGDAIFLDCKQTASATFSHSEIAEHQMNELLSLECEGHRSGYMIFFSKSCQMVFFDATTLFNCRVDMGLKPEQGILLGNLFTFNLDVLAISSRNE